MSVLNQPLAPLRLLTVNKEVKPPDTNYLFREICSIVATPDVLDGRNHVTYEVSHPGNAATSVSEYSTGGYSSSPMPAGGVAKAPVKFRTERHMGAREDFKLNRTQDSRFEELRYNAQDMVRKWYDTLNYRFLSSLFDLNNMYDRVANTPGVGFPITGNLTTYLDALDTTKPVWQPLFQYLLARKYYDYKTDRRRLAMVIDDITASYFGLFYEFGSDTLANGGAVRISRANMNNENVLAKMMAHLRIEEVYVVARVYNEGTKESPVIANPGRGKMVILWVDSRRGDNFDLVKEADNKRYPVCGPVIATDRVGGVSPTIRQILPTGGQLIESFFADGFARVETNIDVQCAFADIDPGIVISNFLTP